MDGSIYYKEFGISNSEFGGGIILYLMFWIIPVSPMGARLLKRWLVFPLKDIQKINERLELVEFLFKAKPDLRNKDLFMPYKLCGDIERLVSKKFIKR